MVDWSWARKKGVSGIEGRDRGSAQKQRLWLDGSGGGVKEKKDKW